MYKTGGNDELDTTIELPNRRGAKRAKGGHGGLATLREGMDV